MTELHWSVRRDLERMRWRTSGTKIDDELPPISNTSTAQQVIDAIVDLVERQRWAAAQEALTDQSKYPQRWEGHAKGLDALLRCALYLIQRDLRAEKVATDE